MKEDYQKALKKLTLFVLRTQSLLMEKQKEPGTSDQLLFMLQNKFRKVPLLIMYYMTKSDDII